MKKHTVTIVIAVFCILLLMKVFTMENDIQNLRTEMNSQFIQMSDKVSNITSNVRVAMEEQNNLLSEKSWEYGAINVDKKEVEILFSVVPKEYSPKDTKAFLIYNGAEYPMSFEKNQYTAVMNIPLFEDSRIEQVVFQENEAVRTQALDVSLSPRYDCLPTIDAMAYGSFESTPGTVDIFAGHKEGLIVIDIEHNNHKNPIKEVNLVTVMDREEIDRTPIDISYEAQKAYLEKDDEESSRYELASPSEFAKQKYSRLFYYIDKDVEIPLGSTLEWYIEVVDSYGLRHCALCDDVQVSKDGNFDVGENSWHRLGMESSIYDSQGNILYMD